MLVHSQGGASSSAERWSCSAFFQRQRSAAAIWRRMGDAHDVAEIARRLAGLRARQLLDLELEVLRQQLAHDHRLAEEFGGDHAVAQGRRQRARAP